MALVKGTNSFATVSEADQYFSDRLDAATWSSADATRKAQSLVTASGQLNELVWAGTAVNESQPLAFPRSLEYFDPKLGCSVYLDGTTVPDRVVKATYELALHMLSNENLIGDSGSIDSISVGEISLNGVRVVAKMPSHVKNIVKPLLSNGYNVWWRAN